MPVRVVILRDGTKELLFSGAMERPHINECILIGVTRHKVVDITINPYGTGLVAYVS